jgi:hypothetical protein
MNNKARWCLCALLIAVLTPRRRRRACVARIFRRYVDRCDRYGKQGDAYAMRFDPQAAMLLQQVCLPPRARGSWNCTSGPTRRDADSVAI